MPTSQHQAVGPAGTGPPESPDQAGVEVGIGLLSRWPLTAVRAVALPSRHRTPAPVAAVAAVQHPAGPLHVVAACLEATELIDKRIDHIFVRPGQPGVRVAVESVALIGGPVKGLHASDHRAVVCDLAWAGS